jgi:hypothetical protein
MLAPTVRIQRPKRAKAAVGRERGGRAKLIIRQAVISFDRLAQIKMARFPVHPKSAIGEEAHEMYGLKPCGCEQPEGLQPPVSVKAVIRNAL